MELTTDEYLTAENLSNEIWKDIDGYEGLYQVSNLGRIKSMKRIVTGKNQIGTFARKYPERILQRHLTSQHNGYYQVTLCKDGHRKAMLIHRLVAEAFLDNVDEYPEVNHKDRNKLNNNIDNLEWCDKLYNMHDAIDKGWNPHLSRKGMTNGKYQRQRTSEAKSIQCRCIETNEIFSSYTIAEKKLHLYRGAVSKSISKGVKLYNKYSFKKLSRDVQ